MLAAQPPAPVPAVTCRDGPASLCPLSRRRADCHAAWIRLACANSVDIDPHVRLRAFHFLEEQTRLHSKLVSRPVLERGVDYKGARVPLLAPQGIFKPKAL